MKKDTKVYLILLSLVSRKKDNEVQVTMKGKQIAQLAKKIYPLMLANTISVKHGRRRHKTFTWLLMNIKS